MAEEAVKQLLSSGRWKKRYFGGIKKRVAGFEDDELRRLLVRSGAVPRHADPLHVTVLPLENQSEHGLHDRKRCERSREDMRHLLLHYSLLPLLLVL
jgi:hypothetical protein